MIAKKYSVIKDHLNERSRRLWAAVEADSLGYGGQRRVHEATGLSNNTIRQGILELKEGSGCPEINQIRQKGGGRQSKLSTDTLLEEDIEGLPQPVVILSLRCDGALRAHARLRTS